jgi:hypothetical protein
VEGPEVSQRQLVARGEQGCLLGAPAGAEFGKAIHSLQVDSLGPWGCEREGKKGRKDNQGQRSGLEFMELV